MYMFCNKPSKNRFEMLKKSLFGHISIWAMMDILILGTLYVLFAFGGISASLYISWVDWVLFVQFLMVSFDVFLDVYKFHPQTNLPAKS